MHAWLVQVGCHEINQVDQLDKLMSHWAYEHVEVKSCCRRAGALDEAGLYTNTEDTDCEVCKGDLHLWAVISEARPGRVTCAEHCAALDAPPETLILLYRRAPLASCAPALLGTCSYRICLLRKPLRFWPFLFNCDYGDGMPPFLALPWNKGTPTAEDWWR
jgi:hypothetical protein